MTRALGADLLLPALLLIAAAVFSALALYSPGMFIQAGFLAIAAAFAALAFLFPATFLGIMILSLVTQPEIHTDASLAGLDVKALQKIALLLAIAVNIYRYGFVWRSNPPLTGLAVILLITLLGADMLPFLTPMQMVRSMIALVLPFIFLHCLYRRDAIDRYLLLIAVMPAFGVAGGILLDIAGIRAAGPRLSGMGHAATLAMFAYTSFFVCVYQVVAAARPRYYWLAAINLLIILMTITRMPMLASAIVIAAVMLFAPQETFRFSARAKVALVGAVLLIGAYFVFWPLIEARIENSGTSGRDVIWEIYWAAIERNPWFGRGIGSGTVLLPNTETYTKVITVAHNEYMRLLMDGGIVGLIIYISALILWVRSELRFMRRDESVLFLGFMVAFAVYSATDNTLSAQPVPVTFFALALMIQRARQRQAETARGYQMPVAASRKATGHPAEI